MRKSFLLLMLMAFLPMVGFAAELVGATQHTNDGYQYRILSLNTAAKTGTVSVSQSNWAGKAADKTKITINPTIKINVKGSVSGTPVDAEVTFDIVEIEANGFKDLSTVTTIEFPTVDGVACKVNKIGAGAFAKTSIAQLDLTATKITTLEKLFEDNNVKLLSVKLPATLTTLAPSALANCIQLGGYLTDPEDEAQRGSVDFSLCTELVTLGQYSLSNTIVKKYDFSKCTKLVKMNMLLFVNQTTKTNKNLEEVVLPLKTDGTCPITHIGTVFANCEKLATITNLDKSQITDVIDGAFANDISLAALSFPKTLKTVKGAPFAGCKTLASLTFDGTALTQLGNAAADKNSSVYAFTSYGDAAKTITWGSGTAYVAATDVATVNRVTVKTNSVDGFVGNVYYIDPTGTTGELFTDAALTTSANIWITQGTESDEVKGAMDLFGNYKHLTAWGATDADNTYEDFDSPLTSLTITKGTVSPYNVTTTINASAFSGNGADKSALTTISIADGGVFKGTIAADAIVMAANSDATVTFGDIDAATFNTITGPQGTNTATLTMGKYTSATLTTKPILSGTISAATINGVVAGANVLDAIGQAQVINFKGNITAPTLTKPSAPNAALTTLFFGTNTTDGGIEMATGAIVKESFNEDNAPQLTSVYWKPADAKAFKAFDKEAFGKASVGLAAKVTLYTTTKVRYDLYEDSEGNLWNVIFNADAAAEETSPILVYGTSESTYYYGMYTAPATGNMAIANKTEDNNQVVVYSAFVDGAAQNIYMDALAQKDDNFIVAKGQTVIVRVKQPTGTQLEDPTTGYKYELSAKASDEETTMRLQKVGTDYVILNDLLVSDKVFSSDYIATNYVGKTLYAMASPARVGYMKWQVVKKTSYLPEGALYVVTDEVAAARLNVVWLDGSEDVTGIIDRLNNQKFNSDAIYNLNGIRVNGTQKGIYIKNGKKYIVK